MANPGEPLYVPEDITGDILLRLPVESLLRCQCVCKSWRDLIQSAQFVQSHTNNVNRSTRAIFFKNKNGRFPDLKRKVSSVLYVEEDEVEKLKKMKLCDTMHLRGDYRIHGHCNGIICISRYYSDDDSVPDILLWNPTLRQCRALPPTRIFHLYRFGFGYDNTNQDYKVVRLPTKRMSAMYSFKSNSWKPINCHHLRFLNYRLFAHSTRGCLFKGRLHWIVHCICSLSRSSKMFLVVFDLNVEKFLEFDTPETLYETSYLELGYNLGVFKGRLSWLRRNLNKEYEIWSLKDDSCMPESWTRTCNFSREGIRVDGFQSVPKHELWSIELTEDGRVLMRFGHRCKNLGSNYLVEINRLEVPKRVWIHWTSPITNYLETLVSVIPTPIL